MVSGFQGGDIVVATALAAKQKLFGNTIPQISANAGVLTMIFPQINGDGAGPIVY
ncbi:uncharacterized protein K444DRAFT_80873 [Hyaloscypha bicolor E]|uniref:Uncharacterized protein n=1 Tax=Hyaloscypha bicolor E TaxID=1095630 RepID=A0A2J6SYG7_9HELO|nr:uncharacterized protein K444DRAFT_80873 [Hyaloscypha bicolor E]PMD55815.1 hypothetical protein K444DRAFT_80873 [Hyaloscypha bicolor E]